MEKQKKVEKKKFVQKWNYEMLPEFYENTDPESLAEEGQSYTIPELMQRMNQGLSDQSLQRQGVYEDTDHEDHDLEKLGNLDLAEKDEIGQEVATKLQKAEEAKSQKKEEAKPVVPDTEKPAADTTAEDVSKDNPKKD